MREKGTSLYIVDAFACSGYTSAAIPRTSQVLAIFDPITFPSARSVCPLIAENTFTKSSGAEVPNATIVSPITSGEIHNSCAIEEAHFTSTSAHFTSIMSQIIR